MTSSMKLGETQVDDFIWVKYSDSKFYVGKVVEVYGNWEFTVKFLRNRSGSTFCWPQVDDISDIEFPMIVRVIKSVKVGRRGEIIIGNDDLIDV